MNNKFIIISMFCFATNILFSQSMTEIRQMRYEAIGVFDKYCTIIFNLENPNNYTKDDFTVLFEDTAKIYNDILPDNQPQYISIEQYYDRYISLIKSYPKVCDLELGFPYFVNEKWCVKIKFKKKFSIKYRKSAFSYPDWSFNYEMLVIMDKNLDYQEGKKFRDEEKNKPFNNPKIRMLTVNNALSSFFIIQLNDQLLNDDCKGLHYKPTNEKVELTDEQQRRIFNSKEFKRTDFGLNSNIDDDFKTTEKLELSDAHYWIYDIVPLKNIIGFSMSYSPFQFGNNINNPALSNISLSHYNTSFSFIYGRLLATNNRNKFYLNTKLGYAIDFFYFKGSNHNEYQSIDTDNDSYLRKIDLTDIRETDVFHCLDIPLSLGYVRSFGKLSLTFDIGAWINFSLINTHKSHINALYSGVYPQYWDLTIDKNGYYDFGQFILEKEGKNLYKNSIDYGAFSSIGIMYKIQNGLHIKTEISYRYGFVDKASYMQNYIATTDYNNFTPFFYTLKQWNTNNLNINISLIKKI